MQLTILLAVALPFILGKANAQADSRVNRGGSSQTIVREEIFPIFLVDDDSDDDDDDDDDRNSAEKTQTEPAQASDSNINIEEALKKIKEAEKVLEQLETQESVNRPTFAKSINEKLSRNDDQDSSFDSTREGKVNGVFTHPRLQSPTFKQQVDFDDSSPDSQQFDDLTRETKAQAPQKRGENALEEQDKTPILEKPSLLLTLGGYQRPFESERKQSSESEFQNQPNNDKSEERKDVNIIVPHVTYNDQQSPLMRIPGMGYQPQAVNSPAAVSGNNQDLLSPYSAFQQNQQTAGNLMAFQPLPPNLQNVLSSNFPTPIQPDSQPPSPNGYFFTDGQTPTQADYFSVNNPFNTPSGLPYASSGVETNPFQNLGFQTNNVATNTEQNVQPSSGVLPANYYDSYNVPEQVNSYPAFQNFFPPHLYQAPRFPANTNILAVSPDGGQNQEQKTDAVEQELESVSREQSQTNPNEEVPTDNQQYMNVPLQNAGYGVMEPLPNNNQSTSQEIPRTGRLYPHHFNSMQYPYSHPYRLDQRLMPFPPIRDNTNRGSSHQGTTGTDANTSFISDEYFKHLRSPYPFPFSHTPYGGDSRFPYSNRPGETRPGLQPNSNYNPYGRRNLINTTFGQGTSTDVRSLFNFNPRMDNEILRRLNPDVRPACAGTTNSSICFQDENYPREYVLHALDSEALMLRRLLPDTSIDENVNIPLSNENDICQVEYRQGRPQRAMDTEGKWKVIVNAGTDVTSRALSQNIRLETCRNHGQPCSHTAGAIATQCVQKYSNQRLLAWSPDNGLHMSMFRFPVACSCQVVNTSHVQP